MFETFVSSFQAQNAPEPHDVAVAIAALIATPAGQRPDRVVVGAPYGADAVNAAVAPVQNGVVDALGLGALKRIAA